HRCTRPAGAVQIGRLRPISPAEGNLGNYPWPPALDSKQAFHPCNISNKETNYRGDNSYETWRSHSAFRIGACAAKILIDPFLSDNPSWDKAINCTRSV